jgi:NitT/TauT family transport system ATP-binding protein
MPDASAFIQVEQVSHQFPDGLQAIADVSLTIEQGAFVALVGASGVGKSTLLRIIAGLLPPTQGRVSLAGQPPPHPEHPIGIVFQRYNLMPWRTTLDNVCLPLELKGVDRATAVAQANEILQLVGLANFTHSYPAQLSGGMAQRVALARGLIHHPALLLLDEPFGALDALTRERMGQELLRIWNALPVTVFLVTHSINEAVLLADELLVMNGRPGTITHRLPITLPRPRRLEMQLEPEFLTCATAVRQAIELNGEA